MQWWAQTSSKKTVLRVLKTLPNVTLKHGRSSDRFYLYRSSNVYCHTYILGIWILFSVSLFWKTEYKTEPK